MLRDSASGRLEVLVHAEDPALAEVGSDHLGRELLFGPVDVGSALEDRIWGVLVVGEVDMDNLPTSVQEAAVLAATNPGSRELVKSFAARGLPAYDASVNEAEVLADRAMALLLGALKNLPAADTAVRSGEWRLEGVSGDLWGARVGLAGGVASERAQVVRRLSAFACDVVELSDQEQESLGARDRGDSVDSPRELTRLDALVLLDGPSQWISLISSVDPTPAKADTVVVDLAGGIPGHPATCGRAVTLGQLQDEASGLGVADPIVVVCGRGGSGDDEGRAIRSAVGWLVGVASGSTLP